MVLWKSAVTNRTQSDVNRIRALLDKGYEAFTEEEREEWKGNLKGALNIGDLYRIKNNIQVLKETLELDITRVELGSNLIPYPYSLFQAKQNNIEATVNLDGSITVSGTATADTRFVFINEAILYNTGSRFFLSGCPTGGSISTYWLEINAGNQHAEDYGAGVFFNPINDSELNTIAIGIKQGAQLSNVTFWPMLCWVDITGEYDRVYEKYRLDRNVVFPPAQVFQEIHDNVTAIRAAYSIHTWTPEVPPRPYNTFQKWNDIELILEDVYNILMDNFNYLLYAGGEIFCGEGTGLLI